MCLTCTGPNCGRCSIWNGVLFNHPFGRLFYYDKNRILEETTHFQKPTRKIIKSWLLDCTE